MMMNLKKSSVHMLASKTWGQMTLSRRLLCQNEIFSSAHARPRLVFTTSNTPVRHTGATHQLSDTNLSQSYHSVSLFRSLVSTVAFGGKSMSGLRLPIDLCRSLFEISTQEVCAAMYTHWAKIIT